MSDKPRYRVTFEFDAPNVDYAERYAAALDYVWDDYSGITSQSSTLHVSRNVWGCLAEPIRRNAIDPARLAGSEPVVG